MMSDSERWLWVVRVVSQGATAYERWQKKVVGAVWWATKAPHMS
jgi:hypothetical protein